MLPALRGAGGADAGGGYLLNVRRGRAGPSRLGAGQARQTAPFVTGCGLFNQAATASNSARGVP